MNKQIGIANELIKTISFSKERMLMNVTHY
jgi:hypothetical protein